MSHVDRIGRSLFVALAVGLAWGIRGDFGHLVGAMYPGAILALGLAYVSGQRSLFRWMPVIAALSALAIGAGGTMSYGKLHGYAQADTLVNYGYGFLTLFLQGSAWGVFGGALIGLMLERRPVHTGEWLGLIGSVLFCGWMASFLLVDVLGFQINPPRNNGSIGYMGAALGLLGWLACHDRPVGWRGALLGYLGFGIGMAAGRLLGNTANVLQGPMGVSINHWNVMETSCGFIAGLVYAYGMLGHDYPEPPDDDDPSLASSFGIVYVLGLIPLWHRLNRIDPAKLREWSANLKSYGYAQPDALATTVLRLLDGVIVLGFLGAAAWMLVHFRRRTRWAALPVFWLSATMLLFQNIAALYPFYPVKKHYVNMHSVFWLIFGLMVVYAVLVRPHPAAAVAEGAGPRFRPIAWVAGAAVVLAAVIALAGLVNGAATMRSANTRWPEWSWSSGPFPGRSARP
jgi:hypothetical protein